MMDIQENPTTTKLAFLPHSSDGSRWASGCYGLKKVCWDRNCSVRHKGNEEGLDLGPFWAVLPSFFFDGGRIEDPTKKIFKKKEDGRMALFPAEQFLLRLIFFFCLSARLQIALYL